MKVITADFADHLAVVLPAGTPAYVVTPDGSGGYLESSLVKHLETAVGFHLAGLDLVLRPELERQELWFGRGFATAIRPALQERSEYLAKEFRVSPADGERMGQAAIVLHEAAHWLADDSADNTDVTLLDESTDAIDDRAFEFAREGYRARTERGTDHPLWHQHGLKFIRAACHAWARQFFHGPSPIVPLGSMLVAGKSYGLSDSGRYVNAFADELRASIELPIRDVLQRAMPQAVLELWKSDTGETA